MDIITDKYGTHMSKLNGVLHSFNDEPSWIHINGCKRWYKNGLMHRDNDLPAEVDSSLMVWYNENKIHRENGKPACIYSNGRAEWWTNGNFISYCNNYNPQRNIKRANY